MNDMTESTPNRAFTVLAFIECRPLFFLPQVSCNESGTSFAVNDVDRAFAAAPYVRRQIYEAVGAVTTTAKMLQVSHRSFCRRLFQKLRRNISLD